MQPFLQSIDQRVSPLIPENDVSQGKPWARTASSTEFTGSGTAESGGQMKSIVPIKPCWEQDNTSVKENALINHLFPGNAYKNTF